MYNFKPFSLATNTFPGKYFPFIPRINVGIKFYLVCGWCGVPAALFHPSPYLSALSYIQFTHPLPPGVNYMPIFGTNFSAERRGGGWWGGGGGGEKGLLGC